MRFNENVIENVDEIQSSERSEPVSEKKDKKKTKKVALMKPELTLSLLDIDDKRKFSRKMLFEQQLPYLLVRISTSYYVKLGTLMKTYNCL